MSNPVLYSKIQVTSTSSKFNTEFWIKVTIDAAQKLCIPDTCVLTCAVSELTNDDQNVLEAIRLKLQIFARYRYVNNRTSNVSTYYRCGQKMHHTNQRCAIAESRNRDRESKRAHNCGGYLSVYNQKMGMLRHDSVMTSRMKVHKE